MRANPMPHHPISGIALDSRQVKPGYLFAAIKGQKLNGADFIPAAIKNGAKALLVESETPLPPNLDKSIEVLYDPNPRLRLAKICAEFYRPVPNTIIAVTGTNGKTSVASFTRQIWAMMGRNSTSIGTLGIESQTYADLESNKLENPLTTPDQVSLHQNLQTLKKQGHNHIILEASSHGLAMNRLDGVRLMAAAFTNLGHDHLDYHETTENYFNSKFRLFEEILLPGMAMIVHAHTPYMARFQDLAKKRQMRLFTYSLDRGDVHVINLKKWQGGFVCDIKINQKSYPVSIPLSGNFQLENMLCAVCLLRACGEKAEHFIPLLSRIKAVRGRLEWICRLKNNANIFVDYAHTPDALERLLKDLRTHTQNKLHVIVGAGGDRDKGKRKKLGQICAKYADEITITDDNPRNEDPAEIRLAVMVGSPNAQNIASRKAAIHSAIDALQSGDVLVVAGKGHEQGQEQGGKILPFDDKSVITHYVAQQEKRETP